MIECFLNRNDLNIDEKVNQYSQMIQLLISANCKSSADQFWINYAEDENFVIDKVKPKQPRIRSKLSPDQDLL